jgi:hypothetical protein
MTGWKGQLGIKKETGYGTLVTVDHFLEFEGETPLSPRVERMEARTIRTTVQGPRTDRFVPYVQGHEGQITAPVLTRNFAILADLALGTITTSSVVDSCYTHTASIPTTSVNGDSFTMQCGVPQADGTVSVYTYSGCKVTSLSLSMEQGALLQYTLGVDAKDYATAGAGTALTTASYAAGATEPIAFVGGSIVINGSVRELTSFGVDITNTLPQRPKIGNVHPEPLVQDHPEVAWSIGMEHDSSDFFARVNSATAAGALGTIVATFRAPTLAGTATYPEITVTIPQARFDDGKPALSGPGLVTASYSGKAMFDGTNSMVTIAVKSLETAP